MNYTKNMWDTWKDFRLDETPEDELTELIKEFIKQGVDNLDEVTLPHFSSPEAKEQIDRDMKREMLYEYRLGPFINHLHFQ